MRQLTYVAPRKYEWWDVEAPTIAGPRDAIIEPLAVARCDLDLYIALGVFPLKGNAFAVGHETVGRVVDLGDAVRQVDIGDLVVFPFQVSCGDCPACRRGDTGVCSTVPRRSNFGLGGINGVEWGGSLSERMRVPYADHLLMKLPPGADPAALAGAADNVTDGYRAVAPQLEKFPGGDVLIVGGLAQSVGLYAAQAAKALTSGRVLYVDNDAARLAYAAQLGTETMAMPGGDYPSSVGEFAVVVDASASSAGLMLALNSTAHGGICTCVAGGVQPHSEIPRMRMYDRNITLDVSRANVHRHLSTVVDHICRGHLHPTVIAQPAIGFSLAAEVMTDPAVKAIFVRDF